MGFGREDYGFAQEPRKIAAGQQPKTSDIHAGSTMAQRAASDVDYCGLAVAATRLATGRRRNGSGAKLHAGLRWRRHRRVPIDPPVCCVLRQNYLLVA